MSQCIEQSNPKLCSWYQKTVTDWQSKLPACHYNTASSSVHWYSMTSSDGGVKQERCYEDRARVHHTFLTLAVAIRHTPKRVLLRHNVLCARSIKTQYDQTRCLVFGIPGRQEILLTISLSNFKINRYIICRQRRDKHVQS